MQRNVAREEGEWCVHCAAVLVELFCANESAQLDLFFNVFLRLTQSGPKCWTQKCKVYRRNTPEHTLWNLPALSIFSSTAPGSMCPNWNPQLLKAINAIDFWGHCCFSAHFDFHWRRPLQHWSLINCKIVCRMNHERNDMLTEILTFQKDIFIELLTYWFKQVKSAGVHPSYKISWNLSEILKIQAFLVCTETQMVCWITCFSKLDVMSHRRPLLTVLMAFWKKRAEQFWTEIKKTVFFCFFFWHGQLNFEFYFIFLTERHCKSSIGKIYSRLDQTKMNYE